MYLFSTQKYIFFGLNLFPIPEKQLFYLKNDIYHLFANKDHVFELKNKAPHGQIKRGNLISCHCAPRR